MIHAREDYTRRIQDAAGLIPYDEPVLLIRGQDVCALPVLDSWLLHATAAGADDDVLRTVAEHRERIVAWQFDHETKVPDLP